MPLRIVPFTPGRRPTDEDDRTGFGASDSAALITGGDQSNRAILLFDLDEVPPGTVVEAELRVDGSSVPGWERRQVPLTVAGRQRFELRPDLDLADIDVGLTGGFMQRVEVELRAVHEGQVVSGDKATIDLCDLRRLGTLYERIVDRLVAVDTTRQATKAKVVDPGVDYHPWFPVLRIGGDKAALYTAALVADIVDKENHLSDPAWLLRVGVYLELLTCLGIVEAVREDVGDLLDPAERAAYDRDDGFAEIRRRIDPERWRTVWKSRRIAFPRFGNPRTGPVSVLNLLRKRDATLLFLHAHHEDLKNAIDLAGPNNHNAQETWHRVFRDAERAVLRKAAAAFPELGFLPTSAREVVMWQRMGFAGRQGVYPTACNQYRASMNTVAEWAKDEGLFDYAGAECVPSSASLLEAMMMHDKPRVAMLQRNDGLGPNLTVPEPVAAVAPTTGEIERLLSEVPIFEMLSAQEIHSLAQTAKPLLLGPDERFVVQGSEGTSLFLVGEGTVEVRLRKEDGTDWLVERMGPGEVVGEMSLLTGDRRAATVRSVEESVVYEIAKQHYEPLLVAHPEWLDDLAILMEERLARRHVRIGQLEARSGSVRERIRRNFLRVTSPPKQGEHVEGAC